MRRLSVGMLNGSLLLSLVMIAVCAGTGDSAVADKDAGNPPTIDAVTLVEAFSESEVTAMTPLSVYRVKVTASDVDTIDDIRQIEFHVYYGKDGKEWDADELAIFVWDKTAGWSMQNGGATTTWEIATIDCVAPVDSSATTGDWYLAFRPGRIARANAAQKWFASAEAREEKKGGSGTWRTGASMAAYSEVEFDAAAVVFGDPVAGIQPGTAGAITSPATNYLTVRVTSNTQYQLAVKTDGTWSDGGANTLTLTGTTGVPSGTGQLSLEIDDAGGKEPPGRPKTPQAMTSSMTTIAGYEAVAACTTKAGDPETANDHAMYMAMWFSLTGIEEVVYSGTITFTVVTGS